ncbi:MauE/DoxX family redox-associated membrane protein [Streptomyces sp. NPDC001292]|uniref:MauE/DoxX family redox-associated membrane protein n=1 Tax=Streptomyces sp. NPDC001292 TaxID=3364558 RepID=UPI003696D423
MDLPLKAHHIVPRLATGAFILHAGLGKLSADEQTEQGLHAMAIQAYPFLGRLSPHRFTRLLGTAEVTLGAALLAPLVPSAVAGAGLTAFSSGLVGLYLRTPGAHAKGSPLPTQQGIPLAKDTWLLAIGLGLLTDRASWSWPRLRARRRCARRR